MARGTTGAGKVLRDGDIVFRLGDARVLRGMFPMSRFYANASNSKFSHTGIVAFEDGGRSSTTRPAPAWPASRSASGSSTTSGNFGVKRLEPEHRRRRSPRSWHTVHKVFEKQPPFDYELGLDDSELYCVEMTEKAYRYAGLPLSEPVKLGDMERATEFPVCMLGLSMASRYVLEKPLTPRPRCISPATSGTASGRRRS